MQAQSFGDWLRRQRRSHDLTQAGLAEQVGCSAAAIRKIEAQERRPSAQIVERLAAIFDIPAIEQAGFMRFARGEMGAGAADTQEASPWNSYRLPRSNLPATVTSLVGRDKELVDVRNYLLTPDVRLVTLTGPPGIGKTRLSIEAARSLVPDFPAGVFFAALGSFDKPALIAPAIARAMGYVGATKVPTTEQLKEAIGDKHILLLMDNCEHLIEHAASLATFLISACPFLKLLATSRESLRVPGEWLYPVRPLEVPGKDLPIDGEATSKFPALTLFAERARAVQPGLELDAENIRTASAICRQLDGLPLAIELIAARTRLLSLQSILEKLSGTLILTADGMRAVPPRQKSLNNAIDWSYKLLTQQEQETFAYLSIFSGGLTLKQAETILSPAVRGRSITDLITSLLDKSLLQRSLDSKGEPRYIMLALLQEFARERLKEAGRETELRNLHLDYFLDLAAQADTKLRGREQAEWLKRLETSHDNLRAALDWAIETGQTEKALQLACRLWWFWSKRSEFNEGRQWLGRVLALSDAPSFPDLYAGALTQLAHHSCLALGPKEARSSIQQALTVARAHGSSQTLAQALMVSGIVLTYNEDYVPAQSSLEQSISMFTETQDEWSAAVALMSLGYAAYRKDERAAALSLTRRARSTFRALGDQYFESVCLYEIGNLKTMEGHAEAGLVPLRESLRLSRDLGSRYEIAAALIYLAKTEQLLRKPGRAVRLLYAARNVYDSIGVWQPEDESMFEQYIAPGRSMLDQSSFGMAAEEGHAMTLEQAIAYALGASSSL